MIRHHDDHCVLESPGALEPVEQPAELRIRIRKFAIVQIRRRRAKIEFRMMDIREMRVRDIDEITKRLTRVPFSNRLYDKVDILFESLTLRAGHNAHHSVVSIP